MAEFSDLEGLESLHRDLLALSESRLVNVDRLWAQLEARIDEFRHLLEKAPRSEQSRQSLATGRLQVLDEEYTINEEFQQNALQLADALNIDELHAARIFLKAQGDALVLGRPALESSIIRFHQTRQYLLDSLRLVLQQSTEIDDDQDDGESPARIFRNAVDMILGKENGAGDGSAYVQKCLQGMADIKAWLQSLAEKLNSASVLGQTNVSAIAETIEYQHTSLIQQHESLGVIVHYLIRSDHSKTENFEYLLGVLKKVDKYDNLLVHYFPAVGAFISAFGAAEGLSTLRQARSLNVKVIGNKEQDPWTLHYVHAAISAWWLAEYSGWYTDNPVGSPLAHVNLADESAARSKMFSDALKDGAFDFLLSLSADVKSAEWVDPARDGLRQWLQRKSPPLTSDSVSFSAYFHDVLMEQLESFIDAFITNMPDVLRRLRTDEDEQRQLSQTHEHDLDLERFLVTISFAFEGRPDAAQVFWSDPDSNLAGFLHWASRRASTPLVSAFCEMLQALSENEECATSAHEFLIDEGASSSGKMRRNHSLTWNQIFKELAFFSSRIRDRPAIPQSSYYRSGKANNEQAETEPESAMMLESYLRLITRLCTESAAARTFLLKHPTFRLTELLYQLASSLIPSRLRACAFTTLRSLSSRKTRDEGEYLWNSLDVWISGGFSPGANLPRSAPQASSAWAIDGIFQEIGTGFEEPNAFIQLLEALVAPYADETGLNDSLPFPETLGSSSRMPGIDPYVDFAVGQIFGGKTAEQNDAAQMRLLHLSCLNFISTCLSTFNEDLVVFANRSSISVDGAIRTSDLTAYVCLHPFARVMEWIFNDRVMAALFGIVHQDAAEIAKLSPDSPLVLCLLRAIEVITLVMNLQSTYLNIVRPTIKLQPTHRRTNVANAAFASFEDGILNNLSIITDLGLYCGAGHPNLTIASLTLLEKLSTAPKLVFPSSAGTGRHLNRNKAIAAMESHNDAEQISRSLLNELESSAEIEIGPLSNSYLIKTHILDFLNGCLEAGSDRPTIAHLLLGFQCGSDSVDVGSDGAFARRDSIFHATLDFVTDGLIGDEDSGVTLWLMSLKHKALQLLKFLWGSRLTSQIVLNELRSNDFLTHLVVKELVIDSQTLWDGRSVNDDHFISTSSAECLFNFLQYRASALQYIAADLRRVSQEHAPALKQRLLSTLLGCTTVEDGQQIQHSTIFDFFDFMELEPQNRAALPELVHLSDVDLSVCMRHHDESPSTYDLLWVEELLALKQNELSNTGLLVNLQDVVAFRNEAQALITYLRAENHLIQMTVSRIHALEAWVQVMLMMVKTGGLDGTNKTEFILRALQVIIPKLEKYSLQSIDEALQLASLARFLIFSIEFDLQAFQKGDMGELINDRLFELFRICLRAVHSPIANAQFKETLYCILYRYLTGMSDVLKDSALIRKHSTNTIKASGERLMDVVCDDAYSGEQTCRISALLLLSAFVNLARLEDSKYVVDCLLRLNFIGLIVDSIKSIPIELRDSKREDVNMQLSYYGAKLALLLHVCQTRFGATAVLNAGLFQSVKESELFSTDPDLGVDIDDPAAVQKYYELLAAIMRVINAALLSRGSQNEQTLAQGRKFLSENRLSTLTVFKRSMKLGAVDDIVSEESVEDLAESYMLLISLTSFLDVEDSGSQSRRSSSKAFT